MKNSFENQIIVVTGASRGIGAACCRKFASLGGNLVIHYHHHEQEALVLKKELEQNYHSKVLVVQADLQQEAEIHQMIEKIMTSFGQIDVLVNNAAMCIDSLYEEKNKENFMQTLEVNVVGTFLLTKQIGEMMLAQKSGTIVMVASTNGIDTYSPMCLDYDASKSALISLTHNLAYQYAPFIRVNAVCPGWVATEAELVDLDQEFLTLEAENIFVKRIGKPEEIANVVAFLSSDEASYINNAVIRVDGGHYS